VKQIAVAVKSEEESAARAKAAEAEKTKVEKEEEVKTVRQVAEANRQKEIEVIDAKKEAEREAVGITVEAQAKKEAAENTAAAILTEAKAGADAKMLQAEADEKVLSVEAAGKQALHEAENTLKAEQIELQRSLAILQALPEIVANAVKPIENIDGIKILQGYGSTGGAGGENGVMSTAGGGNLADQVTTAALNYRANGPVVDALLKEVGLVDEKDGSLSDLVTGNSPLLKATSKPSPQVKPEADSGDVAE
jgi:uncharacterized membrane protein YqiK